jgi:hypothetical protein
VFKRILYTITSVTDRDEQIRKLCVVDISAHRSVLFFYVDTENVNQIVFKIKILTYAFGTLKRSDDRKTKKSQ